VGGASSRISSRPSLIELLELSTIRGAEVMGIDKQIGSLESGKMADILIYNMENPLLVPTIDPVSSIVLYATASDIDTVIIDGKILKQKGDIKTIELSDVLFKAQNSIKRVWDEFLKENEKLRTKISKHIPNF
jgi:5-methylthioadenosine/S-adenosylhomocysteine deaminase